MELGSIILLLGPETIEVTIVLANHEEEPLGNNIFIEIETQSYV